MDVFIPLSTSFLHLFSSCLVKSIDDLLQLRLALRGMSPESLEYVDADRLVTPVMLQKRPDRHAKELRAVVIAAEGYVAVVFVHGFHGLTRIRGRDVSTGGKRSQNSPEGQLSCLSP